MQTLRTKYIETTAYHLCGNEVVEIFHRQLKMAIATQSDTSKWSEYLPLVLLGLQLLRKISEVLLQKYCMAKFSVYLGNSSFIYKFDQFRQIIFLVLKKHTQRLSFKPMRVDSSYSYLLLPQIPITVNMFCPLRYD